MYGCKQCSYKFILGENRFSKVSSDPKIISESLNLVMSEMSYRVISRHIYSTHQMKISHVSINRWIKKYTEIIKEYVDSLNPELSDVWSLGSGHGVSISMDQKTESFSKIPVTLYYYLSKGFTYHLN